VFVETEMARMDGNAVVVLFTSLSDKYPISFLFTKIQSGSIGDKEDGEEETDQSEPSDNVKLCLIGDVIVDNCRSECTEFSTGCRESVSCGSNGSGIEFGSEEEGGGVGSELLPKGGKHVEESEDFDWCSGFLEGFEFEGADNENDENDAESDVLHSSTAVESMIDKESCHVVADKRDTDIEEVPVPSDYDCCGGIEDFNECTGKDLGSIEEEIVTEPAASCSDKTMPVMIEDEFQRFDVVTSDIVLLLGQFELSIGELQFVDTMVDEIQSNDTDKGK